MASIVDDQILARAQRGDAYARDQLLEAWLPVVLGWCTRLGGPRGDAAEAAHAVLLVMVRRMEQVYDAERFAAWLFGITRRTIAQHRRRAWFRRWVPGAEADRPDPSAGPARLYEVSELGGQVQEVLEALPELEREVLVLCLLEEWTDREVAGMLEVPVGTVKSRLHRARDRFIRAARARGLTAETAFPRGLP